MKYVNCESVPCRLPEEMARDIDALTKTLPADCKFIRKSYTPEIQFEPGERAEVSCITSEVKDLAAEVILVDGIELEPYRKHNRVIWNHNRDLPPVGECQWIKKHGKQLRAKTSYPERVTQDADTPWYIDAIWDLVLSKALNCKSIGYLPRTEKRAPTAEEMNEHPDWTDAGIYDSGVLLEYSLVPIGCNPEAVMELVNTKSYDSGKVKELCATLNVQLPSKDILDVLLKADDCVSQKIKYMYDQGEDSKYSRAQIAAIAYDYCHGKKKKAPDASKLIEKVVSAIELNTDRIVKLAVELYKNRGKV